MFCELTLDERSKNSNGGFLWSSKLIKDIEIKCVGIWKTSASPSLSFPRLYSSLTQDSFLKSHCSDSPLVKWRSGKGFIYCNYYWELAKSSFIANITGNWQRLRFLLVVYNLAWIQDPNKSFARLRGETGGKEEIIREGLWDSWEPERERVISKGNPVNEWGHCDSRKQWGLGIPLRSYLIIDWRVSGYFLFLNVTECIFLSLVLCTVGKSKV